MLVLLLPNEARVKKQRKSVVSVTVRSTPSVSRMAMRRVFFPAYYMYNTFAGARQLYMCDYFGIGLFFVL